MRQYAENETYSNKWIRLIHTTLKTFVVKSAHKILSKLPDEYKITSKDGLNGELLFEWEVFEEAHKRWRRNKWADLKGKYSEPPESYLSPKPEIEVLRNVYFTIISKDTRYLHLVKEIMHVYAEKKEWKKRDG